MIYFQFNLCINGDSLNTDKNLRAFGHVLKTNVRKCSYVLFVY